MSMQNLQEDVAGRLEADEYFSDIPAFSERKKDVANEVERALGTLTGKGTGGKKGICVVVMSPVGSDGSGNLPMVEINTRLAIRVLENVLINGSASGTKKSALDVAERIIGILKHYWPRGLADILVPETPSIVPVDDPSGLAYEVRFETTVHSKYIDKATTPEISVTGAAFPKTLTITATAGHTVYWTRDLSHPRSGNTSAAVYSGPVELTAAATVRAVAYKTGMAASDAAWMEVE